MSLAKNSTRKRGKVGILGKTQYGGRKQRRSSDVAFINEMIMEYHQITYVE